MIRTIEDFSLIQKNKTIIKTFNQISTIMPPKKINHEEDSFKTLRDS